MKHWFDPGYLTSYLKGTLTTSCKQDPEVKLQVKSSSVKQCERIIEDIVTS